MRSRAVALLMLVLPVLPPARVHALGLAEVLARVAAHPELEAQAEEAAAARAEAAAVRAEGGPRVEGRFEMLLRRAQVGGAVETLPTHRQVLALAETLWDGGRQAARAVAAAAEARLRDYEARERRRILLLEAVRAYAGVQRARARLEAALASERRRAGLLAAARERYRRGLGTAGEVARLEARHAEAAAARRQAAAELARVGAQFRALVGVPPAELEPADPPADLPGTLEAALAAVEEDPRLAAARAVVDRARAALGEARAARLPALELTAQIARTGGADPRRSTEGEAAFGAVLRWPLFDSGVRAARLRAARHRLAAAEARLRAVRRRLEAEVRDAFARVQAAEARHALLRRRLEAARIAFEAARREARAGVRAVSEVLLVEDRLAEAERALAELDAERLVAGWTLGALLGRLDAVEPVEPSTPGDDPAAGPVAAASDPRSVPAIGATAPLRRPGPAIARARPPADDWSATTPGTVSEAARIEPAGGPLAEGEAPVSRGSGVLYGRLTEGG